MDFLHRQGSLGVLMEIPAEADFPQAARPSLNAASSSPISTGLAQLIRVVPPI
jgi:hypothetical protein